MQCLNQSVTNCVLLKYFYINKGINACEKRERVGCGDEPTEKYHTTLQNPAALLRVLELFSSLFWLEGPATLLFCLTLTAFINPVSGSRQLFSAKTEDRGS